MANDLKEAHIVMQPDLTLFYCKPDNQVAPQEPSAIHPQRQQEISIGVNDDPDESCADDKVCLIFFFVFVILVVLFLYCIT